MLKVKLTTQKDVGDFCNAVTRMKSTVKITALNTVVDASSLMGIMTLNLSEPIELTCENEKEATEVLTKWSV